MWWAGNVTGRYISFISFLTNRSASCLLNLLQKYTDLFQQSRVSLSKLKPTDNIIYFIAGWPSIHVTTLGWTKVTEHLVPVLWPTVAKPRQFTDSIHFWELKQENLKSVGSQSTIVFPLIANLTSFISPWYSVPIKTPLVSPFSRSPDPGFRILHLYYWATYNFLWKIKYFVLCLIFLDTMFLQRRLFFYYSPKRWGIIFPLWGTIPSFGKKKKRGGKKIQRKSEKKGEKMNMWPVTSKHTSCRFCQLLDMMQNVLENIRKIKGKMNLVFIISSKFQLWFSIMRYHFEAWILPVLILIKSHFIKMTPRGMFWCDASHISPSDTPLCIQVGIWHWWQKQIITKNVNIFAPG